ncbi:PREDICTED: uncharacterized protein LOC106751272, partial [Dinoponera quadriceps]|uniref:Uncharacterized protein LOC106751272 n=1 Tax=Dinoponera quadriceps TaxID=609295 RepID=A0A6P3Y9K8_DINQU
MSRETESLIRAQAELHGRISCAYDNLKKLVAPKITRGAIESRLKLSMQALSDNTSRTTTSAVETAAPKSTLPRIQLSTFSGRFEDWPPFRDLFTSISIKDRTLSAVERLHYLKTNVKGNADSLIRCFSTTTENFQRAWDTLSGHYENRRLLLNSYYNSFLSLPRMKNESVEDLRRIFHGMTAAVGSLEGLLNLWRKTPFNDPRNYYHGWTK